MNRIVEISNPSVERMIAEYRLAQMTKSIRVDQETAVEMEQHVKDLKLIRESLDGKGKTVDITI
jgi:hypothetical protein